MSNEKTQEYALLVLPHLVACARQRMTITYGELARRVNRHHRPLRYALGYVRDEICRPRDLPLISALVVNKETGRPGESFLPEGTLHLTDAEYAARFASLRDQAFAYPHWEVLLQELGLRPAADAEDSGHRGQNVPPIRCESRSSMNGTERRGTQEAVVDLLTHWTHELEDQDHQKGVVFTPDPQANALIMRDPFAFLLAVLLTRGSQRRACGNTLGFFRVHWRREVSVYRWARSPIWASPSWLRSSAARALVSASPPSSPSGPCSWHGSWSSAGEEDRRTSGRVSQVPGSCRGGYPNSKG